MPKLTPIQTERKCQEQVISRRSIAAHEARRPCAFTARWRAENGRLLCMKHGRMFVAGGRREAKPIALLADEWGILTVEAAKLGISVQALAGKLLSEHAHYLRGSDGWRV